jgi:hypothetical protein
MLSIPPVQGAGKPFQRGESKNSKRGPHERRYPIARRPICHASKKNVPKIAVFGVFAKKRIAKKAQ